MNKSKFVDIVWKLFWWAAFIFGGGWVVSFVLNLAATAMIGPVTEAQSNVFLLIGYATVVVVLVGYYINSARTKKANPIILTADDMIFWIHKEDALREDRASIYVGIGWQNSQNDAKYWLEPAVQLARSGKTLPMPNRNRTSRLVNYGINVQNHYLDKAQKVIEQNQQHFIEEWHVLKSRAGQ